MPVEIRKRRIRRNNDDIHLGETDTSAKHDTGDSSSDKNGENGSSSKLVDLILAARRNHTTTSENSKEKLAEQTPTPTTKDIISSENNDIGDKSISDASLDKDSDEFTSTGDSLESSGVDGQLNDLLIDTVTDKSSPHINHDKMRLGPTQASTSHQPPPPPASLPPPPAASLPPPPPVVDASPSPSLLPVPPGEVVKGSKATASTTPTVQRDPLPTHEAGLQQAPNQAAQTAHQVPTQAAQTRQQLPTETAQLQQVEEESRGSQNELTSKTELPPYLTSGSGSDPGSGSDSGSVPNSGATSSSTDDPQTIKVPSEKPIDYPQTISDTKVISKSTLELSTNDTRVSTSLNLEDGEVLTANKVDSIDNFEEESSSVIDSDGQTDQNQDGDAEYDYSYYSDFLDFGNSDDDYAVEGERLAKMMDDPLQDDLLADEDYYEYDYSEGTIKIPFNYSGLQSNGLSKVPRAWDARVAFLEQVGMRLYMVVPAMAGGVLLGLIVWLVTIFIIRSYGAAKGRLLGSDKNKEEYKLDKIDKKSLPIRGEQHRESDRRRPPPRGGGGGGGSAADPEGFFTSFMDKSGPNNSSINNSIPCYIPEPDYGHDNVAYTSTDEEDKQQQQPVVVSSGGKRHLNTKKHHIEDDIVVASSVHNNKMAPNCDKEINGANITDSNDASKLSDEVHSVHSLQSQTSSSSGIGNSDKGSFHSSSESKSGLNDEDLGDNNSGHLVADLSTTSIPMLETSDSKVKLVSETTSLKNAPLVRQNSSGNNSNTIRRNSD